MTKQDALDIIQSRINTAIDPVELLHWCWLRAIINQISYLAWEQYVEKATEVLAHDL